MGAFEKKVLSSIVGSMGKKSIPSIGTKTKVTGAALGGAYAGAVWRGHRADKALSENISSGRLTVTKKGNAHFSKSGEHINPKTGKISYVDRGFFGHAKVPKQNIVKNLPPQPSQFGKDGWYSNVQNCEGKL